VAGLGPSPQLEAAGLAQPAATTPTDSMAHPAAVEHSVPPAAREQPAAELSTWGSQHAVLAADPPRLDHSSAQTLLDEQSRSASRSMEAAAARPQRLHMGTSDAVAAGCVSQHEAAGQRPMADRSQQSDAAVGRASMEAALPGGMMCTQPPPQLGPALSCGQQLQMQLQQPFTFEGAFSDDSRSCPLSPSV
jgi:hypothetical protein